MESGLVRGAVVRALGDLKAASALPLLAKLYADVKIDTGGGYRSIQAMAEIGARYEHLASLVACQS